MLLNYFGTKRNSIPVNAVNEAVVFIQLAARGDAINHTALLECIHSPAGGPPPCHHRPSLPSLSVPTFQTTATCHYPPSRHEPPREPHLSPSAMTTAIALVGKGSVGRVIWSAAPYHMSLIAIAP
ncbi:hypothetical protein J6590_105288 [Homalodisca vitripennis]|nr:hypothetical protein J6590_105288 [Homalodisca vitripennis]